MPMALRVAHEPAFTTWPRSDGAARRDVGGAVTCSSPPVNAWTAAEALRVETIESEPALDAVEARWRTLVGAAANATVFDTPEWQRGWLTSFWSGRPIEYLFFWEGDTLVGAAPLLSGSARPKGTGAASRVSESALETLERLKSSPCAATPESGRSGLWCRAPGVRSGLHPHSYRANVVVARPELMTPVLWALLDRCAAGPLSALAFPNAVEGGLFAATFSQVCAARGLRCVRAPGTPSPVLRVHGRYEDYLVRQSSHLAKQVKRNTRRFERAGPSEVRLTTSEVEVREAMRVVSQVESRSWKESGDGSLIGNPALLHLHQRFAQTAARQGWLRLSILYLRDNPIAYLFGSLFKNRYYAFKTAYDAGYHALSPGLVLLDRVIQSAFGAGWDWVDLGPGAGAPFKEARCNELHAHVHLCAHGVARFDCIGCAALRTRAKPWIRRTLPGLVRLRHQLGVRVPHRR